MRWFKWHRHRSVAFSSAYIVAQVHECRLFKCLHSDTGAQALPFQASVWWHRSLSVAFSNVCIVAQAHECRLPSQISLRVSVDVRHHERRRVSPFKCLYCGIGARVSPFQVCIVAQAHACHLPSLISHMVSAP